MDYLKRLDLVGGLKEIADFLWQSLYLSVQSIINPAKALSQLSARKYLAWGMLALVLFSTFAVHRFYYHQVGFDFLANWVLVQRYGDLSLVDPELVAAAREHFASIYLNTAYVPVFVWFVYLLIVASLMRPFSRLHKAGDKPLGYGQLFLLSVMVLMPMLVGNLWLAFKLLFLDQPVLLFELYPLTLRPVIFPLLEGVNNYWLVILGGALAPISLFALWSLALTGWLFHRLFALKIWVVLLLVLLLLPVLASFNYMVQQ